MDPSKLCRGKTKVSSERNGFEPEFRGPLVAVNVDMRRFIWFVAVKVHPVRPCHEDGRHSIIISLPVR